ncbi:MAG: T9SS type A sorting domain-containing protein [Flavobacteriaceae bacterium]|nr:T9SS type A sorting domain-containing protein [Flavobacteriaceae bacterium]
MKFSSLLISFVLFCFTHAQVIVGYDFNNQNISDWTLLDEDSDGNHWIVTQNFDNYGNLVDEGILSSKSYDSGKGALTPDNWAIAPVVNLSSYPQDGKIVLKWKVKGIDPKWSQEHYSVYVSTSSNVADLKSSAVSFSETLPAGSGSFVERTLDISSFAGNAAVYVAFRHHNSTNQFAIAIDDVSIEKVNCISIISDVSNYDISTNSASFNWSGTSDTYEIAFVGNPNSLEVPSSSLPFSLPDFYSGSTYEYFIRGKCSDTEYSDWNGPYYFKTMDQIQDISAGEITSSSSKISWKGINSPKYDVVYGPVGFFSSGLGGIIENDLTTEYYTIEGLDEFTEYDVYVRGYDGGYADLWYGPISFITSAAPADLDYTVGFEDFIENQKWTTHTNSGSDWEIKIDPSNAYTGDNYAACYSDYNDSWFFSRGINLEAKKKVKVVFYYRAFDGEYPENLKVTIGGGADAASQSTTLVDIPNITNENYIKSEIEYTPEFTGVHYLGFQSYSDDGYYLFLDDVSISSSDLGVEDIRNLNNSLFYIYPNPVREELKLILSDKYNLLATKVTITDMSGRLIKTFNYNSSYDVRDLPSGIYVITVSDGYNKESKKLIKQ